VEDLLRSRDVTLLVNNAGNGSIARTPDLTDAHASSTLALNVTALVRLSRAAIPGMLAHGRGIIVNVGSVMAFGVVPVSSLYNATKSFVLTFSRGLAEELDGTGIHVQAVLPAGTTTEFYDAAGIPMSSFDQSVFMSAEALVDAALVGLDRRETVTLPSVEELSLWEAFDEARAHLFAGTQIGQPASRYRQ
jgi:short-subunit dehydrogenase